MASMRHPFSAVCVTALLICIVGPARADEPSNCSRLWEFLQYNCNGAAKAWEGKDWDLYLPGYINHGSGTYSPEKLATLNSSAWGGGIGKRYVDENNRTHFIYTAVYQDSHYKPEYFAGYGWLAHWKPWDDAGLRIGGGFTATVTLKSSYSNYMVPVPVLLPIAEIAWDKFSIMGLYVPRLSSTKGNGDVLLLWGRLAF
jgi:lipid IVA palmitoyltransferase